MWYNSCHCGSDTCSSAANDVAAPSGSLTPTQQGGDGRLQRDVQRIDSFELGAGVQEDAVAIQTSFVVAQSAATIASLTQRSVVTAQLSAQPSNLSESLSTGLVPVAARHSFMGHEDEYLHSNDLKKVLGRTLDRGGASRVGVSVMS